MNERRIAVTHIASGDLWAGAEVQLFELARELRKYPDIVIDVVLLNDGELAQRLRNSDIPVTVIDEKGHSTPSLLLSLWQHLHAKPPRIVHTHRFKENIMGAIAALCISAAKSVRTVHGAPEHAGGGIKNRVVRWIDTSVGRLAQERIIAVSDGLANWLTPRFGKHRVTCIPNGISVEGVRDAAAAPTVDLGPGFHVGFIGRLVPVKRVDLILQIAVGAARRHPDRYRFHIIGDGPLANTLQAQADSLGLRSTCRFLGFQRNCLPLLKQMDVLLLTSDHEGLPMVALEALALGVPVVSHAVGGLVDLLRDPSNGALIKEQNPEAYLDAIDALVSRTDHIVNVPGRYTIQACARAYRDMYFEIDAGRRYR